VQPPPLLSAGLDGVRQEWRARNLLVRTDGFLPTIATMSLRGITLFIAVVLLWTGLNTAEAPRGFAVSPGQMAAGSIEEDGRAQPGSVEDHHLDDLPLLSHAEPPAEPHDAWPSALTLQALQVMVAMPRPGASTEPKAPVLAEPLRPPCAAGGWA
jgi:hypothetical protein